MAAFVHAYITRFEMKYKLHHEGVGILLTMFLLLCVINGLLWGLGANKAVSIVVSSLSLLLFLMSVNFFRSPRRQFLGEREGAVIAPADGTVVAVEKVEENEILKSQAIQVSIFMSIFNVHANWFPVDGEVVHVEHQSGRFQAAYLPKSSTENERSSMLLHAKNGAQVLVRQIAGAIARRIVTYPERGDEASIDNHFGFIKFGSRVDVYLPLDTEVKVKIGDKTTGGVTEIAHLK